MIIQAAIFDMDGTVVDNMYYHEIAWATFCKNHGIPFDQEMYYTQLNGKNAFDSFSFLLKRKPTPTELKTYTDEKESLYREIYAPNLKPAEGLVGFLNLLKEHDVRCAVATSAPVQNIHFTLEGSGLKPLFDVVVDASMVQHGKPAPDIFLKSAELAGASESVVFEDALLGIQAGKAAGMPVVGLATSHTKEELAPLTDLVIADFREIDWSHFEALLHK
ncbi:MAG: HAD family phosphatase [Siphonobacter sp.]